MKLSSLMRCKSWLPFALLLLLWSCENAPQSNRFVVVGHPYPLNEVPEKRADFAAAMAAEHAQYLFVLGDFFRAEQPDDLAEIREAFAGVAPRQFWVPGNHDLQPVDGEGKPLLGARASARAHYDAVLPRRDTAFSDGFANYLLLNSNTDLSTFRNRLSTLQKNIDPQRPCLYFAHHRLWTERAASDPGRNWSDKAFKYSEIYDLLAGADHVFSGDYGKDFAAETHDHLQVYSCGMASRWDRLFYVVGEWLGDSLVVSARYPLE